MGRKIMQPRGSGAAAAGAMATLAALMAVQLAAASMPHRPPPSSVCAKGPPYPQCASPYPRQGEFSVSVLKRDPFGMALISASAGDSFFPYNFNGPWFPPPRSDVAGAMPDGLIVRVQEDWKSPNATHPEWTDTGALTVVSADVATGTAEHIGLADVFWPGTAAPPRRNQHEWGAIDPRIAFRYATGEYFLTWDNCTFQCAFRSSMLSVSKNPFEHNSWELVGPVIPNMQTAGVSLLFADEVASPLRHLAFVSSYNCFNISLAESADGGRSWHITDPAWMHGRPGCWDACGAIAGPQPEVLSTGDYLFVYNIDTRIGNNVSNPLGRCTIGWAILDRNDPRRIVARAVEALITPELPWETTRCAGGAPDSCQTPNVIFATGLKPLGDDTFAVIFGAGDTDTGVVTIQVAYAPRGGSD